MNKQCPECGKELQADANFCHHCGMEADGKLKNDILSLSSQKSQNRFLSALTIALIVIVLGFYIFRSTAPANEPNNSEGLGELDQIVETSRESSEIEGLWVGRVNKENGVSYNYVVQIELNGSEIRGTAITSKLDESGSADAEIIGSYSDGLLSFQEYGGGESGEWADENMCFWEFNLELEDIDGEELLTGTFEAIDCDSSGTVELRRAE